MHKYNFTLLLSILTLTCCLATLGKAQKVKTLKVATPKTHTTRVTVFIHGTTAPYLALFNVRQTLKDTFSGETFYERAMHEVRTSGQLEGSDLLLGLGMIEITPEIKAKKLNPKLTHKAAYHIVRAFDQIAKTADPENEIRRYYTFGWDGKMSEKARFAAAEELYDALKEIKAEEELQGHTVSFELHAHSHGGQLVFHLPVIRKQRKEKSFVIDQAIIWGTPLYYPNTRTVTWGMFKKFYSCYSEGDRIQPIDIFSTPHHFCHHTLTGTGIVLPADNANAPFIADIRFLVNGRRNILGHCCLFLLDRYFLHAIDIPKRKDVMAILNHLRPLPPLVLGPLLFPHLTHHFDADTFDGFNPGGYHRFDINLLEVDKNLILELSRYALDADGTNVIAEHPHIQVPEVLRNAHDEVEQAYADTGYVSEVEKTFWAAKSSLKVVATPHKKSVKK